MCGRYAMDKKVDDLVQAYVADGGRAKDFVAAWQGAVSIPPTSTAPIVREYVDDDGAIERELEPAQWGLRPHWMTDPKKRGFHNARLETVAEKPSFRSAFTRHRAVVPMDGYYEWVDTDTGKQPYFIHGAGLLSAAGLYEASKDETGQWHVTYTVITRTARDASGEVHDRMPVFLTDDTWADWISPGDLAGSEKLDMLQLLDTASAEVASTLTTYPVSKRINNVRTASPTDRTLLEPVTLD